LAGDVVDGDYWHSAPSMLVKREPFVNLLKILLVPHELLLLPFLYRTKIPSPTSQSLTAKNNSFTHELNSQE
jgi:hypothetical protein